MGKSILRGLRALGVPLDGSGPVLVDTTTKLKTFSDIKHGIRVSVLRALGEPLDSGGEVFVDGIAAVEGFCKLIQLVQPDVIACPNVELVHGVRMRSPCVLTQPGRFHALYLWALVCDCLRPRGPLELARVSFALEHGLQTDTRDGRLRLKVDTQIYSEKLPKEKLTPNFQVEILGFDTHIFTTN